MNVDCECKSSRRYRSHGNATEDSDTARPTMQWASAFWREARAQSPSDRRSRRSAARLVNDAAAMAYDEDLAHRIRELLASEPNVTEKRMFGGLAFLVGGNMSVAASGQGGLMVRVDPEDTDALIAKLHAQPFEMRGRAMQGWLRVDAEGVRTKRQLEPWVRRGVAYARSLPSKR
jgi:TfoX/Sxy family transcriptional regulator of competence genes